MCINLTNLLYYIAYTIDYIINRSTYHFKEEAQYKDNILIQNDYFLTTFMNDNRNNRLAKLPRIESQPIPELSIHELTKENVEKISKYFTEPFIVRGLIKEFDCVKKMEFRVF